MCYCPLVPTTTEGTEDQPSKGQVKRGHEQRRETWPPWSETRLFGELSPGLPLEKQPMLIPDPRGANLRRPFPKSNAHLTHLPKWTWKQKGSPFGTLTKHRPTKSKGQEIGSLWPADTYRLHTPFAALDRLSAPSLGSRSPSTRPTCGSHSH